MQVETGSTEGTTGGGSAAGEGSVGSGQGTAAAAGGEGSPGSTTPPVMGAVGDGAVVTPPAFTPNWKYKVLKEEREIPEWARPIVTSADAEKQVRDLFERADGITEVKEHRDRLVQENSQMRENWAPVIQNVQTCVGFLQKKDYDSFFQALNIPEADVLRYALHRIQLRDQPGALEAHDNARNLAYQNQMLQQQIANAQAAGEHYQVQQLDNEITTTLGRPENLPTVQAFDTKFGAGAFRAEVVRRGKAYDAMKQVVSPGQVITEMLQLVGWQSGNTAQSATGAGTSSTGAGGETSVAGGQKATLPNIRGKGGSPAKKAPPKSVEGLRQLAREKFASA